MKKFLCVCVFLAKAAAPASASIILSDGFNYGPGPADIIGAAGSSWVETAPAATPTLIYTNNELRVSFQASQDVNAPLQDAPYTNGGPVVALYSSFTARFVALPNASGAYFAHFKDSGNGYRARVWASTSGAAANKFRLGIGNSSGATAASGQIATDLDLNTTYTIVTRYDIGTGLSTIWLNPSVETDPSVTASDTIGIIAVTGYAFRQASGEGTSLIDNLKVGTSFADVAGANSPPSITPIPPQHIPANGVAGPIPFTIGDIETPVSGLTLTAVSTDQALVPDANIALVGTGSARTITVTPALYQQGLTSIRIGLTDGDGLSVTNSFLVYVGAPAISDVPNQIIYSNTIAGPIPFTVSDAETPAAGLTVSKNSSNPALVPDANILLSGSGANRTVTVTPIADAVGTTTITLTVDDGTQTASDSFVLTVAPRLGLLRADDFNRPDGPLVQFDGAWISNGGTGGSNSQQLQIVGNKILVLATVGITNSEDVLSDLPPYQASPPDYATNSGVVFYASMTINLSQLPTMSGDYFTHFRDVSGLGFRGKVYVSTTNASSGHYRIGIANAANSIRASWQIPADLSINTTYFIVFRYNIGTAESYLWLNPTFETSPGVAATDIATLTDVTAFAFRQNAGIGAVYVDDLKVGTSFADVVPPALTITAVGSDVTVSWPSSASGYVLRYTDALPQGWADYNDQGTVQGSLKVVTLYGVTGSRFFELQKP